jgi:hypothetical protein
LAEYSELLAGDQMDPENPKRWLLIRREMDVPDEEEGAGRWSVDHLFLDQDGVPTLVEVKRSSDTRARREVVAQMLDYAANAVLHWPVERIQARFETSCSVRGEEPEDVLEQFLGPDADVEEFWARVGTNLQAKRIRLLFVADLIPRELRRIIEFLNEQMSQTEVLGVEIKQYQGQGLTSLVPRLLGQTAAAEQRKRTGGTGRSSGVFDEVRFMTALGEKSSPRAVAVAKSVLNWSRERGLRIWGGADSFMPVFDYEGRGHGFMSVKRAGQVQFQFYWMKPPHGRIEDRIDLWQKLVNIPGVEIPRDRLNGKPSVPLEAFADPAQLESLLQAFRDFMDDIERYHSEA